MIQYSLVMQVVSLYSLAILTVVNDGKSENSHLCLDTLQKVDICVPFDNMHGEFDSQLSDCKLPDNNLVEEIHAY